MLIKKYVAATMNEALAKVKAELGDDAVILQSRKVDKGGLLALAGKAGVEVTAATPDRHPISEMPGAKDDKGRGNKREPRHQPVTQAPPPALLGVKAYSDQTRQIAAKPAATGRQERSTTRPAAADTDYGYRNGEDTSRVPPAVQPPTVHDDKSLTELRGEIEALKGTIRDLSVKIVSRQDAVGDGLDSFRATMRENGASPERIAEVLEPLAGALKPSERDDPEAVETRLHEALAGEFIASRMEIEPNDGGRPTVIAVVGPTGVGKTTSLAKMATNFDVFGRRKVALISTDTYRVAAVEQLRTFAGIAGLPLDVVYRAEELGAAIDRYRSYDVLLVDTAGRSQNDEEALGELEQFLHHARPDRTLLALSANTRTADQRETLEKYRRLQYSDIMLTKLDEISSAGHLLDLTAVTQVPWVYLTTGQAVPDDILPADPYVLAAMAVRKEYFQHLRAQGFQLTDET